MNQIAVIRGGFPSLSARLTDRLAPFVWDAAKKKQLFAAVPVLVVGLVGASLVLASTPASHRRPANRPIAVAREELTPPMVQLLADIDKATRPASPAAAVPLGMVAGPMASPFIFANAGSDRERAITCLATAGWYEAGNDPAGQRAVMQVVLNRVRHPSFPKSVCGVVFQGAERQTGCQFSFTCDGSMTRRVPSPASWARARYLAEGALAGVVDPDVRQATHFHADYVNPWWAAQLVPIAKVGAHIFYRWGGTRGSLGSGNVATRPEAFPLVTTARNPYVSSTAPVGTLADKASAAAVPLVEKGSQPKVAGTSALAVQAAPAKAPALSPERHFMSVDASGPNGRWALAAMERCAAEGPCRVIAYSLAGGGQSSETTDAATNGVPLFVFARDSSGMQVALWDCQRAPRPRADQCLPSGQELAALLR